MEHPEVPDDATVPEVVDEAEAEVRLIFGLDKRMALILLGGAFVGLAALSILGRLLARPKESDMQLGIVEGDWEASMHHLAAAFELRLVGLNERLSDLEGQPGGFGGVYVESADHATPPVDDNGDGPTSAPPGPAATSLPSTTAPAHVPIERVPPTNLP